ncbi:MAG: membrane dipeptidase, partial [Planctomycetes bacterium]|nr:membrane dipeptidase [Planctomycetota bacterium]
TADTRFEKERANSQADGDTSAAAARIGSESLTELRALQPPEPLDQLDEVISQMEREITLEARAAAAWYSGDTELANQLIDNVEALVGRAPTKFALAKSPEEAELAMQHGLIGLAMGMENGAPLEGKLENVEFFRNRGINYITLTHSLSNHISDSSYDTNHPWNGLSPFGKQVVAEMNRLGVMIDISHVSDDAFWQVLELSAVPVIASHSSARHFTPGWERNMSDEMIQALAARGGVIQINFGSSFLTEDANDWYERMDDARDAYLAEHGLDEGSKEATAFVRSYREENPLPYATMDDLVAHFQHVIELVGVQHVGIGSDFDGVGDSLPVGMKSVADYPHLIEALLQRGYSVDDIAAIMGGNLMRVWRAAQAYAAAAQTGS